MSVGSTQSSTTPEPVYKCITPVFVDVYYRAQSWDTWTDMTSLVGCLNTAKHPTYLMSVTRVQASSDQQPSNFSSALEPSSMHGCVAILFTNAEINMVAVFI